MKQYIICKTRREALGMTQKQVAELAGVSPTTVSRFEQGVETSAAYVKAIYGAIDDLTRKMSREEWTRINIIAQINQLDEEETIEDKLTTMAHIHRSLANMQIDLMKAIKEVRKERS